MTQEEQAKAGEQTQETSLLDDLFAKIDLAPPKETVRKNIPVEEASQSERLALAVNHFLSALTSSGKKEARVDKAQVEAIIDELDRKMSDQISEIMHNEKFQELESAWRGLRYLIDRTNFNANIKVEILNLSKDDLAEDLEEDLLQSGLFQHTYKQEYDQAGGEPFAAVVGNYYFKNTNADIGLLRKVSNVAAASHCPFLSAIGSDFLGLDSATKLHKIKDLKEHMDEVSYTKWRGFRDTEDSRYVGLTYPRFLLRAPYDPNDNPVTKEFNFTENVSGSEHNRYLWGNASLALASKLTESFAKNGWCVNIRGPQSGGVVEDLPLHLYESEGEQKVKIPTEVMISDRRELEFAEQGFIPLTFYKGRDYACFFSAQSAQKPKIYTTDEATAASKMSANLPYLFLASRLSHYLKAIQRENIGALKEKDDLNKELNQWINRLVTNMPGAQPELKARRPLKEARITVEDIASSPGWYNVEMLIRPHFQLEGMNVSMSLVSKMPAEE